MTVCCGAGVESVRSMTSNGPPLGEAREVQRRGHRLSKLAGQPWKPVEYTERNEIWSWGFGVEVEADWAS
jgi:hypothetical protein